MNGITKTVSRAINTEGVVLEHARTVAESTENVPIGRQFSVKYSGRISGIKRIHSMLSQCSFTVPLWHLAWQFRTCNLLDSYYARISMLFDPKSLQSFFSPMHILHIEIATLRGRGEKPS